MAALHPHPGHFKQAGEALEADFGNVLIDRPDLRLCCRSNAAQLIGSWRYKRPFDALLTGIAGRHTQAVEQTDRFVHRKQTARWLDRTKVEQDGSNDLRQQLIGWVRQQCRIRNLKGDFRACCSTLHSIRGE